MLRHPKNSHRGSDHTLSRLRSNRVSSPLAAALAVVSLLLAGCDSGDAESAAKAPETAPATPKNAVSAVPEANGAPAIADPASGQPGSPGRAAAFAEAAGKRVAEKPNIQGDDPAWFFLVRELKQMALGEFWKKPWTDTAQNKTDPIPSMVEFHELLKAKGVDLIIVPVPAKASIYPDKVDATFAPGDPYPLTPLLDQLKAKGLNVIDLEPQLRQRREAQPAEKLWCEQDAHYSPLTCQIIAGLVKTELAKADWFAAHPKQALKRGEPAELEITGDQIKGSEWDGQVAPEKLAVQYAGRDQAGTIEPVEPDPASPVLLIGDSHTLVFQEGASGGMHAKGAGLFDQLGVECGFPIDLVGVRGSGLVEARKSLYRAASPNPDYWTTKKAVVWVFSVREFTQSFDNLISIPIERKQ
jgi:alginate O-acetyltransferase complex protein AlgJ